MAHYDAIFKNGTLANHDGVHRADVAVSGGRIAAIGDLATASAADTIDCAGLHLLPGVIAPIASTCEPRSSPPRRS